MKKSFLVVFIFSAFYTTDASPIWTDGIEAKRAIHAAEKEPTYVEIKKYIREYIKRSFFDPDSVKDIRIRKPISDKKYGFWLICFESNAKNRFGGYVGSKLSAVAIRNGKIVLEKSKGKYAHTFPNKGHCQEVVCGGKVCGENQNLEELTGFRPRSSYLEISIWDKIKDLFSSIF